MDRSIRLAYHRAMSSDSSADHLSRQYLAILAGTTRAARHPSSVIDSYSVDLTKEILAAGGPSRGGRQDRPARAVV
jgi:hypothetical protein